MRLVSLPLVLWCAAGALGAEPARDRFGDPLPEGAVARLGSPRLRHIGYVAGLDFSPDGKILAATSGGLSVICWDPVTGREVRRVTASPGRIGGRVCYSVDGKSLIRADTSGVHVIDAASGAVQRKLNAPDRSDLLAVSRDAKTAVTFSYPDSLDVWDVVDGKRLREVKARTQFDRFSGNRIALTPDGQQLVLPKADGSPYLMDVASGEKVFDFETASGQAKAPEPFRAGLKISPDGRYLASNTPSRSILVHDLKTGKRVCELKLPSGDNGFFLVYTPDSRSLAVCNRETIRIFNIFSSKETTTLRGNWGDSLVFSPDGRQFAYPFGNCIYLCDVATGQLPSSPIGHPLFVTSLHFSPDDKRLLSTDNSAMILWDVAASRILATHRHGYTPRWISVSADGEIIRLGVWSSRPVPGGKKDYPRKETGVPKKGEAGPPRIETQAILRWNWAAGRIDQEAVIDAIAGPSSFAPNGRSVAPDGRSFARYEDGLRIREVSSGKDRLIIPLLSRPSRLDFSPNGRFLVCLFSDAEEDNLRVYSTATGKLLVSWKKQSNQITALQFSHNGRFLAAGHYSGTILLWKLPKDDELPVEITKQEAATFWQELAADNGTRANRALAGLAAAPARAVPLIEKQFPTSAQAPSAEDVARWIADLDADAFKVRERATRELADAGRDAAGALRKALAAKPSPEAKKRIEELLSRLNTNVSPERLRCLRALEVLERIGTPQAKDVLRELARKPLPAELRAEIAASLRRIEERHPAAAKTEPSP